MSSIFKNIENYTSLLTIGNKKDNIDSLTDKIGT